MNPRRSVLAVVVLALVATVFPTAAEAKKKGPKITVMTRKPVPGRGSLARDRRHVASPPRLTAPA